MARKISTVEMQQQKKEREARAAAVALRDSLNSCEGAVRSEREMWLAEMIWHAERDAEELKKDRVSAAAKLARAAAAQYKLENEEYWKERDQRERANARRRANYQPRYRPSRYDPETERREEQSYRAQKAGRAAADRINLQPFLNGDGPADAAPQLNRKTEEE